jgi:hypothetical protein
MGMKSASLKGGGLNFEISKLIYVAIRRHHDNIPVLKSSFSGSDIACKKAYATPMNFSFRDG